MPFRAAGITLDCDRLRIHSQKLTGAGEVARVRRMKTNIGGNQPDYHS